MTDDMPLIWNTMCIRSLLKRFSPDLLRVDEAWLRIGDYSLSRVVHLVFDVDSRTPINFELAQIICPAQIERSVQKRQREFLFGRLAARISIATLTDLYEETQIGYGNARQPIWPQGVIGSISHSHGHAVATSEFLGPRRGIGIDIEKVVSQEQHKEILQATMTKSEINIIEEACYFGWSPEALSTAVFSSKESFYKAVYNDVSEIPDFSDLQLVSLDMSSVSGNLKFILTRNLSMMLCHGGIHRISVSRLSNDFILSGYVLIDNDTPL